MSKPFMLVEPTVLARNEIGRQAVIDRGQMTREEARALVGMFAEPVARKEDKTGVTVRKLDLDGED
jgi:hypothetical protein